MVYDVGIWRQVVPQGCTDAALECKLCRYMGAQDFTNMWAENVWGEREGVSLSPIMLLPMSGGNVVCREMKVVSVDGV